MVTLEQVDWTYISHQELDMILGQLDAQVNKELCNRLTPLSMACKVKREDLVTVLLHRGAQTNKQCSVYSKQPLHLACDHSNGNVGVVRKLLRADADINAQDDDGNTGLHLACTESNIPLVELLIQSGADVNLSDVDGETPLLRACYADNIELINILLKTGSDPNISQGLALELAILNSSTDILRLLLKAGADLNQGSYLSRACEHNSLEMMKILHEYGIDVNRSDPLGMTPLHTACSSEKSSLTCVHLLLQWGARANEVSLMGGTALTYAAISQNLSKIRLLLAYSVNVNLCNMHFLSSLLTCFKNLRVSEICVDIFSLLLAAGITLTTDDLDRLKGTVAFVQNSPAKKKLIDLLDTHASCPLSLQSLCRITIRCFIKPSVDKNIHSLPLPTHIKNFLNFCDIVNEPNS